MTDIKFRDGQIIDWTYVSSVVRNASIRTREISQSVWTEWVNAEDCIPFVIEADGEISAVANLRHLGMSEWWLEGFAIHSQLAGEEGITGIVRAAIERARREDGGVIRIPLIANDRAIMPVINQLGFTLQGVYSLRKAKAAHSDVSNFFLLKEAQAEATYRFLRHSPLYRTNRYLNTGQQWPYLTEDRLNDYMKEGSPVQVLGWKQFNQLGGVAIIFPAVGEEMLKAYFAMHVGFISAPDDTTLIAILQALCGVAARMGKNSVLWQMPLGAGLEKPVEKAGYEPEQRNDTHIYEYLIP